MIRRWLIRGLAMAMLALCVAAWVGSYMQSVEVLYEISDQAWRVEVECGWFSFYGTRATNPGIQFPEGWIWDVRPCNSAGVKKNYSTSAYRAGGFAYGPQNNPFLGWIGWAVMIPLWFPALVSAALLWWMWRRTRRRVPWRGFPVEAAGKEEGDRP
jgi:hypothetical protein